MNADAETAEGCFRAVKINTLWHLLQVYHRVTRITEATLQDNSSIEARKGFMET